MPVRILVKQGRCPDGGRHKEGDSYVVDDATPGGMCLGAWNAVAPYVTALQFGANFPWEREQGVATIHCPDPKGITLELRRVDDESA